MGFFNNLFDPIGRFKHTGSVMSLLDPAGITQGPGRPRKPALTAQEQLAALLRDPNYRGFYPEPTPLPGTPPPTGIPNNIPPTVHRPPPVPFPVMPGPINQWQTGTAQRPMAPAYNPNPTAQLPVPGMMGAPIYGR